MSRRIITAIYLLFLLLGFSSSSHAADWASTYGSAGWDYESAYSVQQASDGGYIVAGMKGSAAWVNKKIGVKP